MSEATSLSVVQVGDQVAVYYRDRGTTVGPIVRTITRTTATQITVGRTKYRRKNGYIVGADSWSSEYVRPLTSEVLAEVDVARSAHQERTDRLALRSMAEQVSIEQVRRCLEILETEKAGKA